MVLNAPTLRLLLVAFCLLVFNLCYAYPIHHPHTSTVFPRQESNLTSPVTVTKTDRITTGAGTFIRTCKITLTPIVVDGVDMVRQEKTCTTTPDNGNGGTSSGLPPGSSPPTSPPLPSSTSPTSTSTSNTFSPTPTATDLSPPGSVPPPAASTPPTSDPSPSPDDSVPPNSDGANTGNVSASPTASPVGVNGVSAVPRPSATQSSENAGAAASLDLPGKKLEVLPIGLGVFAGVSVIALLVVGIVTYERTKHRRNFRRRRLEEAGGRMGYGAT